MNHGPYQYARRAHRKIHPGWEISTASERATSQSFIIELCELLDVPRPHAAAERDYMFEPSHPKRSIPACPAWRGSFFEAFKQPTTAPCVFVP